MYENNPDRTRFLEHFVRLNCLEKYVSVGLRFVEGFHFKTKIVVEPRNCWYISILNNLSKKRISIVFWAKPVLHNHKINTNTNIINVYKCKKGSVTLV